MNIRNTLSVLLSIFGLTLMTLLWAQGFTAYQQYRISSERITIDLARNDLLSGMIHLQNDRTRIELTGDDAFREAVPDDLLEGSIEALQRASGALSGTGRARLQELGAAIGHDAALLSQYADELTAMSRSGDPGAIRVPSLAAVKSVDLVLERLLVEALALLVEVGMDDPTMGGLQMVRNYILAVNNALQSDRALTLQELENGPVSRPEAIQRIEERLRALQASERAHMSMVELFDEEIIALTSELSGFVRTTYVPAELRLLRAFEAGQDITAVRQDWINASDAAVALLNATLVSVFAWSQAHLGAEQDKARSMLQRLMALSAAVLLMFALSLYIVARHIVTPLERLRTRMIDLVEGDLAPAGRETFWLADIRAIADGLRVFRITAVRRERLARERLLMHAQIAEAHHALQSDMKAAAKVQLAQMPPPGVVGQIRFSTYFAPSKMLAGDTFDFLELPGHRVGLFQADVAGHGAAAGLVSVAAHIGARRALRSLKPRGGSLADAIKTLNALWSPEMTYFTLVSIELDVRKNRGRLVQAGHPHPVLIRKDGVVTRLGRGGLPIGVMPDAEFEEFSFAFEPGDKLIVFSDGIYENINDSNEIYTEERFIRFLGDHAACTTEELVNKARYALEAWSGDQKISDDVSLVVAERV
ncbi:MAG: serine/threonine-protein phosphatase [Oceanicaulis sp.]|nr:serine/threonine-protein phosphatase [Oceanicaulis sp.]